MPDICCVLDCPHVTGHCNFRIFPKNLQQLLLWKRSINQMSMVVKTQTRICDCHFENSMFKESTEGRRNLRVDAVPTIFGSKLKDRQMKDAAKEASEKKASKPDAAKEASEKKASKPETPFQLRIAPTPVSQRKRKAATSSTPGNVAKRTKTYTNKALKTSEESSSSSTAGEQNKNIQMKGRMGASQKEVAAPKNAQPNMRAPGKAAISKTPDSEEMAQEETSVSETDTPPNKVWCRLDEICRLCIKKCYTPTNIYENDLAFKIQAISSVRGMEPTDGLPVHICTDCKELTNICYSFKLQVEAADESLKTCIKSLQAEEEEDEEEKEEEDNNNVEKQQPVAKPLFPELFKFSDYSSDESDSEEMNYAVLEEDTGQNVASSPVKPREHSPPSDSLQDELNKACAEFSDEAETPSRKKNAATATRESKQQHAGTKSDKKRNSVTKSAIKKPVINPPRKRLRLNKGEPKKAVSSPKVHMGQSKPSEMKAKPVQDIKKNVDGMQAKPEEQKSPESVTITVFNKPKRVHGKKSMTNQQQTPAENRINKQNNTSEDGFTRSERALALQLGKISQNIEIYKIPAQQSKSLSEKTVVLDSKKPGASKININFPPNRTLVQARSLNIQENNGHLIQVSKQNKAQLCHIEIFKVQKQDTKPCLNTDGGEISLRPVTQAPDTKLLSLTSKLEQKPGDTKMPVQNGDTIRAGKSSVTPCRPASPTAPDTNKSEKGPENSKSMEHEAEKTEEKTNNASQKSTETQEHGEHLDQGRANSSIVTENDAGMLNEADKLFAVKRSIFQDDDTVNGMSLSLNDTGEKNADVSGELRIRDDIEVPQNVCKLIQQSEEKVNENAEEMKEPDKTDENKVDSLRMVEETSKMNESGEEGVRGDAVVPTGEQGPERTGDEGQCHVCAKSFPQAALQRHIASHWSQKDLLCDKCGISFFFPADLERHVISHLSQDAKEDSSQKVKQLKVRQRTYTCGACGVDYTNWFQLRDHKLVHKKGKRHKCGHCKKSFRTKYLLQNHVWVHSMLKTPTCEFCGKTFSLPWYVERHIQDHHL